MSRNYASAVQSGPTHAMHLPLELIQEIVASLATPDYPLQYGHKIDVLRALCQLAATNHFLFIVATPHIYSSVVISSLPQLHAFLSTSPPLRTRVRALWLRNLPDIFPHIADLLYDLSPYLRRLALDIPGNELDTLTSVREALKCCVHIEDFTRSGYSPMQIIQPYPFWPDWTALRHLVLDGPLVNASFISSIAALPRLKHLAVIEPRWRYSVDGTEAAIFLQLLDAGRSLRRVLLIYCEGAELFINSLRRLRTAVKLRGLRPGLTILYMVICEKEPPPMTRIRHQIGDGSLWDRHSQNLLGFPVGYF
ncbi:hypothetical protein H0H81_000496 [Sphagnurus paluster]|uniref:F-box domain-containing protein n=1 Tax=Sphagnurus paluster TaxID=117069 RepID=A0A9P7G074_9AGAR|nr:hypothetical protein H0H81_000496 [Sphagnurus paluster]